MIWIWNRIRIRVQFIQLHLLKEVRIIPNFSYIWIRFRIRLTDTDPDLDPKPCNSYLRLWVHKIFLKIAYIVQYDNWTPYNKETVPVDNLQTLTGSRRHRTRSACWARRGSRRSLRRALRTGRPSTPPPLYPWWAITNNSSCGFFLFWYCVFYADWKIDMIVD